jgi:hypothetical protein
MLEDLVPALDRQGVTLVFAEIRAPDIARAESAVLTV